jgi:hypothetical protein
MHNLLHQPVRRLFRMPRCLLPRLVRCLRLESFVKNFGVRVANSEDVRRDHGFDSPSHGVWSRFVGGDMPSCALAAVCMLDNPLISLSTPF